MKIVIIDNYDSFTYNLLHLLKEAGADVTVFRNDMFGIDMLDAFDKIVLSPGPGIPSEAGLLLDVIRRYTGIKPILGVCLGHQAIGEVFGGRLVNISDVYHGVATMCDSLGNEPMFNGCGERFEVGRYHSWVVDGDSLPACLEVTAVSEDGLVMAMKHRKYDVRGIQFHPESVMTPCGKRMLENWLAM